MRSRLPGRVAPLLLVIAVGWSCGASLEEDPILRLSAEESLLKGKQLMEAEKYRQARPYLEHAFDLQPNSAEGREALLLAADSSYLAGGAENFIRAEAKYRDFQNRFPTSDQAAYVEFQMANSLAKRMEKPDRDQSASFKALESYEQVVRLFPTSEYAAQAREQIGVVKDNLAEAEMLVAVFYVHRKIYKAALARIEALMETYPEYSQTDRALYFQGVAHQRMDNTDESMKSWQRLREEYPESEFLKKLPKGDAP